MADQSSEEPVTKIHKKIFYKRIRSLRWFGCWPLQGRKTREEKRYMALTWFLHANSLLGVSATTYSVTRFAVTHTDQPLAVYDRLVVLLIVFQVLAKVMLMIFRAKKIGLLVEQLNFFMQDEYIKTKEDERVMVKCYDYDVKISLFLFVFTCLTALAAAFRPLVITVVRYKKTKALLHNETITPYVIGELPSEFPFDVYFPSGLFAFCYLHQFTLIAPGMVASYASDSMFCCFLYYVCGHFKILINRIKNDERNDFDYKKNSRKIGEFVRHHRFLISFCEQLQEAFTPILNLQILSGSLTIGILLIMLTLNEGDLSTYIKPGVYLTFKLIQLFITCWHGELMRNTSIEIAEACYFCPWYNQPKTALDLNLIVLRARHPVQFHAARIFQLSADQFSVILNTAYSYFTMMRTVNTGK